MVYFRFCYIFADVFETITVKMRKLSIFVMLSMMAFTSKAQQVLTLEECRTLALQNNKQLSISKMKQDVATQTRKAAHTKYLPRVNAMGSYQYLSKEVSLLNNDQKYLLNNIGTITADRLGNGFSNVVTNMVEKGLISVQTAQHLQHFAGELAPILAQTGNGFGERIADAFHTDTKQIWVGAVTVTQPIFMGGGITAANKMAELNEQMAANDIDNQEQTTLYAIDNAYWLAVSLKHKQTLANSYLELVQKLDDDVHKMIQEGVATRAEGLKVDVAVNEAQMSITQVEDGVQLAKMYLCQLCGLPLDGNITLADEEVETLQDLAVETLEVTDSSYTARPEVRMLQNAVDISKQATKLIKAAYLPHVALEGGFTMMNPSFFNGFERKFTGVWNIGVVVQVPVWSWFEGRYKINASKTATAMASMELADAREKISLQVEQNRFKVKEAQKKLNMSQKNMVSAEENLRCATLGFKEGVMNVTDVMAAQTAWQKAQSQKIDAEIDVKLSQIGLKKALGILHN